MPRLLKRRAATVIEVLVVLSIIGILLVLGGSTYPEIRESLYLAECRAQMTDIGLAIVRYSDADRGLDPASLATLVPKYLPEGVLNCPLVRARAPEAVSRLRAAARNRPTRFWTSYFWFSRRGLDDLNRRGEIPLGYSDRAIRFSTSARRHGG